MAEHAISNYDLTSVAPSGELTNQYGLEKHFPDKDYASTSIVGPLSGHIVKAVWVKNGEAADAILPRKVLKWDSGTSEPGTTVVEAGDGDIPCGVASPYIPAAGAAAGEGFFMIVEGPAQLITDGATTLATTDSVVTAADGEVNKQDASAATTDIMIQTQTRVGRPMLAVTNVADTTFRALVGPFMA